MAGLLDWLLATTPFVPMLTRKLVRLSKSRTNTSALWLVSLPTKFVALLVNATHRPSSLMRAMSENTGPPPPALELLNRSRVTSVVVPAIKSRTKRSLVLLTSFEERLLARLSNRTKRPSGVITGQDDAPFPDEIPSAATLTNVVAPPIKSRTKTSEALFVSLATRSPARLSKATKRPFA